MRVLLPAFLVTLIVLFAVGSIAPRRSQRLQRWIDSSLEDKEQNGEHQAGRLGHWLAKSLDLLQRVLDAALRGGRRARERLGD